MLPSYRVTRPFREPREGGAQVPYRFYEVGVTVTIDDFRAWQIGSEIEAEKRRLIQEGFLVEIKPPVVEQPAKPAEDAPEVLESDAVKG